MKNCPSQKSCFFEVLEIESWRNCRLNSLRVEIEGLPCTCRYKKPWWLPKVSILAVLRTFIERNPSHELCLTLKREFKGRIFFCRYGRRETVHDAPTCDRSKSSSCLFPSSDHGKMQFQEDEGRSWPTKPKWLNLNWWTRELQRKKTVPLWTERISLKSAGLNVRR